MRTRTITLDRDGEVIELFVHEAGDAGPLVVLAHGFPELGYSWRRQLPALAEAGYRAVAPDQRGYGRSSRPDDVDAYDIVHLTGDLLALTDAYGEDSASFVGHDWGAMVVWQLALMAPDRVDGVCAMSVPFAPRPSGPPVDIMRAVFAGSFFYIVHFQEPGVADAELADDPAATMRRMLAGAASERTPEQQADMFADDGRGFVERMSEPERLPDWLREDDLEHYVEEFARTGFTGGLNWYRNMNRNWELTAHLAGRRVEVPSLFIAGSADPVLAMTDPAEQRDWLADHRGDVLIEGAGHWVQQEAAATVNTALLDFLGSLTRPG